MVVTNVKSVRYFVKYRRSVRAYKNDAIEQKVKECIQLVTPAPTSSNK
ncbi:hypothetical protein ACNQF7_12815 [Flavobacterium sp. RSP29]